MSNKRQFKNRTWNSVLTNTGVTLSVNSDKISVIIGTRHSACKASFKKGAIADLAKMLKDCDKFGAYSARAGGWLRVQQLESGYLFTLTTPNDSRNVILYPEQAQKVAEVLGRMCGGVQEAKPQPITNA